MRRRLPERHCCATSRSVECLLQKQQAFSPRQQREPLRCWGGRNGDGRHCKIGRIMVWHAHCSENTSGGTGPWLSQLSTILDTPFPFLDFLYALAMGGSDGTSIHF